jgi:hypothetical protein
MQKKAQFVFKDLLIFCVLYSSDFSEGIQKIKYFIFGDTNIKSSYPTDAELTWRV